MRAGSWRSSRVRSAIIQSPIIHASAHGTKRLAMRSAQAAMAGIPEGSADYLRAQDIAMAARGMLEGSKKRK